MSTGLNQWRQLLWTMAFLSGCGADFSPPSLLSDLRVLALVAEPVEAGPQDEVRLQPFLYLPPAMTLVQKRLSFCPFSLGAGAGFRCALPACESELSFEPDGSARVRPGDRVRACAASLGGNGGPAPEDLPESIEVLYRLALEATDGLQREAVLRQVLWTRAAPPVANRNPVIAAVTMGGVEIPPGGSAAAVAPGEAVEVRVRADAESLDTFVDESGRQRREDAVVSFFSTAGRFDFDQGAGTEVSVTWKADDPAPAQEQAELFFVLRDLRGGQAVSGPYHLPLAR